MKYSTILIILLCFFNSSINAQLIVKDQESTPNILLKVNDEGTAGSIELNDAGEVTPNAYKLYNNGGNLYWSGNPLATGSSSPWSKDGNNIYLTFSGNVGIGNPIPTAKLTIHGDGTSAVHGESSVYLSLGNQYFDYEAGLIFRGTGAGYATRFTGTDNMDDNGEILGIYREEGAAGDVRDNLGDIIASFSNNGNVGVGKSNPSHKLDVYQTGEARAASFSINNPNNGNSTLYCKTSGTGNAGRFQIANENNPSVGLYSYTNGTGPAIVGNNFGNGSAAAFNIQESANNNTSLEVNTKGTGSAGIFTIDNGSNTSASIVATTNGSGPAIQSEGTIKIIDGNQAAGKVFTSDAVGIGTWQLSPSADNLGNHVATQDLLMGGFEVNLGGGWLSNDGDEEGVYVSSDGKVGIGHDSPASALDVLGKIYVNAATDAEVTIGSTNSEYRGIFTAKNGGANNYIQMGIGGLTYSEPHFGHTLSNWGYIYGNNIDGLAFGTLDDAEIIFGTNNSERMRLDNTGNFGIGTSDPSAKLTIGGGSTSAVHGESSVYIENSNQYFDYQDGLVFRGSGTGWATRFTGTSAIETDGEILGIYKEESAAGDVRDDSGGIIATFRNNGNVGIGESDPNEKLEVEGKIRANSGFNVDGINGINGTFNFFNDGTSGNVIQITVNGGIITNVELAP